MARVGSGSALLRSVPHHGARLLAVTQLRTWRCAAGSAWLLAQHVRRCAISLGLPERAQFRAWHCAADPGGDSGSARFDGAPPRQSAPTGCSSGHGAVRRTPVVIPAQHESESRSAVLSGLSSALGPCAPGSASLLAQHGSAARHPAQLSRVGSVPARHRAKSALATPRIPRSARLAAPHRPQAHRVTGSPRQHRHQVVLQSHLPSLRIRRSQDARSQPRLIASRTRSPLNGASASSRYRAWKDGDVRPPQTFAFRSSSASPVSCRALARRRCASPTSRVRTRRSSE